MAVLERVVVLIPMLLSMAVLILSALSLFAGHKEGFMEDYAIARLNVSRIGYDILSVGSDDEANTEEEEEDDGGFFDSIKDTWNDAKDTVVDEINDIVGDVAGDLADTLGISEWYSLHVMDACEGYYAPNATAEGASLNITDCTNPQAGFRLNLTKVLDRELELGPFELNIADLGWDEKIQDKINILNDALLGLFILYVLGMGFSGLAVMGCVAAIFLVKSRVVALVNFILSTLAAICLIVASIIVTVAVSKGVSEINDVAEEIGVNVEKGNKFLIITWVAAGVMIAPMIFWAVRFCVMRREKKYHSRRMTRTKEVN